MIRICLFIVTLMLFSCSKHDSTSQQALRVNIFVDPQTLDPRKARDLNTITLMRMIYEGLTRVSKTGEVELALAQDVKVSDDRTQYTFTLRESFWSNGEPVTSFDFADCWKSTLDPRFPSDVAYQLYVIKNARKAKLGEVSLEQVGIHTPDQNTLIVDLEQPIPYFLELVSMTSFFPVPSKIARLHPEWGSEAKTSISNGPFSIKSWRHSDQIKLTKNQKYWQADKVHLSGLKLLIMPSDTEMQMFEEGKLEWAGSPLSVIPPEAIQTLKEQNSLKIAPFSATYFFRVNTADEIKGKKNPFRSALFRKALSFTISRKDIAEHILQGGHIPARALVPPQMGLSEKGYFHDDHVERGRMLLKEAMLEMEIEKLDPIVISYSNSERNASIAQAIQKQWEDGLGIEVQLEAIEPKTFFQRVSSKEFQLAAGSWTADFNDPINFLEVFKYKKASTNNTNWESSKYIDLLNRSALCKDSEERRNTLRAAEQILMEQMPIIPIYHFAMNYLQKEGLEDVVLSPLGQIDFRWAKLTDEKEAMR